MPSVVWKQITSATPKWVRVVSTRDGMKNTQFINTILYQKISLRNLNIDINYLLPTIYFAPLNKEIYPIEIIFETQEEAAAQFESIQEQLSISSSPLPRSPPQSLE